ncbi:MAG TPA: 50S ribosomal protein L13 [Anaerolineales bacterium]|nr:50S ribosomal protein L13 [Anaerolineales bacterium]
MQKTYHPRLKDLQAQWYLVDAAGQNMGRLASRIAGVLLGKHKPTFTPGVEVGDFVVVINAEKIEVTGKRLDQKVYYRHSGYPGGLKTISLRNQLARFPTRVMRLAVWGMLPHNRYGRRLIRKLKLYAGAEHPHRAQKPQPLPPG